MKMEGSGLNEKSSWLHTAGIVYIFLQLAESFKKWKIFCVRNELFSLNGMRHQLVDS